jgi:hypothetical protein
MRMHGAYSLTSTTTSARFGAEALLAIVRRRERESPATTQLIIDHADWFAAHQATARVPYDAMSETARAAFEHRQDALVEYGPGVVARIGQGPRPRLALAVTLSWPDTGNAPSEFSYQDTLSKPRVEIHDARVVRFALLDYDSLLVVDRISGISVRPFGFLSAIFAVLGRPELKQTRIAVSSDEWQVVRGQVRAFLGVSKTGTIAIEPDGRGHEDLPADRADLHALKRSLAQPIELSYGEPSCQARRWMQATGRCRQVLGGGGC